MADNMSDRELLELAAIAYTGGHFFGFDERGNALIDPVVYCPFNPLKNDGDALRLAVKLGMNIDVGINPVGFTATAVIADYNSVFVDEYHNEYPLAATRRAIVRAAAEIGRQM